MLKTYRRSEDLDDNVINFDEMKTRLAYDGVGSGNENWLEDLPQGTIFASKDKKAPKEKKFLDIYLVCEHKGRLTNLIQKTPTAQQIDLWFNTLEFSRDNIYVDTIATVEIGYSEKQLKEDMKLEEEDINDGDSGRPV